MTDDSGLPHRIGILKEDVFRYAPWKLPVDPSTPIPVEITIFLAEQDIAAAPGIIIHLKPSVFPYQPLPDPDSDTES